jgi:hypothetical protein
MKLREAFLQLFKKPINFNSFITVFANSKAPMTGKRYVH